MAEEKIKIFDPNETNADLYQMMWNVLTKMYDSDGPATFDSNSGGVDVADNAKEQIFKIALDELGKYLGGSIDSPNKNTVLAMNALIPTLVGLEDKLDKPQELMQAIQTGYTSNASPLALSANIAGEENDLQKYISDLGYD